MATIAIDVDGSIGLIEVHPPAGPVGADAATLRQSRLNDVMIVLEREQVGLENAIFHRLAGDHLFGPELAAVTLSFSDNAPVFHVGLTLHGGADAPAGKDQVEAVEREIATALFVAIEKRVARTDQRQWQPSVTATYRRPRTGRAALPGSLWLKTLLWLLAAVILATGYLFLKR